MTWLPLWPFLCGRTKPVLDTAIRTLADQRPGHRLRVATENESGAARTRTWNQRIMSPVRTRMDLRMTCDSLQTPGLRVHQTARKLEQSRVQVTLQVTLGR